MSLDAAVLMAELEAAEGMTATYFLMTRGDFYNLDGTAGQRTIGFRLRPGEDKLSRLRPHHA